MTLNVDPASLNLQKDVRRAVSQLRYRLLPSAPVASIRACGLPEDEGGLLYAILQLDDGSQYLFSVCPGFAVTFRRLTEEEAKRG